MVREIQEIADRVSEQLTRAGQPGALCARQSGLVVRVRWEGARRDEADAEKAMLAALEAYDASRIPGLGVTVRRRIPRCLDHEECVHNGEPRPETLAECMGAET